MSLRRVEKKKLFGRNKKFVEVHTSAKWQRFFNSNIRHKWKCISSFLLDDWLSLEFVFPYNISNSILGTRFPVHTLFQTTSIYWC